MTDATPGRLTLDFDSMNEADVREIIVRPLLHRLGYRHGTDANIRTEVTLKYANAFLGRKKPTKDPPLIGRADYVCEVISYGRWIVEVKAPSEPLDTDTIEQAHTYAAHPEIGATYIMVTNGRCFELYRTGSLATPLMRFDHAEIEQYILPLFNALGPDAIRKLSERLKVDCGKPLGKGLASRLIIAGGTVTYEEHASNTPLLPADAIEGLQLPVIGGFVERAEDGRIHAYVEVGKAAALFREFGNAIGVADDYDFYSADDYLSTDPDQPTVLQNLYENVTEPGKRVSIPGLGQVTMPFGFSLKAFTQATGFVLDGAFQGTLQLEYDVQVIGMQPMLRPLIEAQLGEIPDRSVFTGLGSFQVRIAD